ncbi:hypothetical protein BDAP_000007 [Binucleata daphniae]
MTDVLKNGFFALISHQNDINLIASKGNSKLPLADIIKSIDQAETDFDEKRLGGEVVQKVSDPIKLPKPTYKIEKEKLLDFIKDKSNQIITLSKDKADKFDISPKQSSMQKLGYKNTDNNIKLVKQFYNKFLEQLKKQANKSDLIIFVSFYGNKITLHAVEYGELDKKVEKIEVAFISQDGKKTLLPKTFITAFISKCYDKDGKPLQRAEVKTKNEMAKGKKEAEKDNKTEVAKDNNAEAPKDNKAEVAKDNKKIKQTLGAEKVAETRAQTINATTENVKQRTVTKNLDEIVNEKQKLSNDITQTSTDTIKYNKTIVTKSEDKENSMTDFFEDFQSFNPKETNKNNELFKRLIQKGKSIADKQKDDNVTTKDSINLANNQHKNKELLIKDNQKSSIENMNTQEFYNLLKKRMQQNIATVVDVLLFYAKNSSKSLESDENNMKKIFHELANYLNKKINKGKAIEEDKNNENLIDNISKFYENLSDEQKNELINSFASIVSHSVNKNETPSDKKKSIDETSIELKCNANLGNITETTKSKDVEHISDDAVTKNEKTGNKNDVNGLRTVQKFANSQEVRKEHHELTKQFFEQLNKYNQLFSKQEKDSIIGTAGRNNNDAKYNCRMQDEQNKRAKQCAVSDNKIKDKVQPVDDTSEQAIKQKEENVIPGTSKSIIEVTFNKNLCENEREEEFKRLANYLTKNKKLSKYERQLVVKYFHQQHGDKYLTELSEEEQKIVDRILKGYEKEQHENNDKKTLITEQVETSMQQDNNNGVITEAIQAQAETVVPAVVQAEQIIVKAAVQTVVPAVVQT